MAKISKFASAFFGLGKIAREEELVGNAVRIGDRLEMGGRSGPSPQITSLAAD